MKMKLLSPIHAIKTMRMAARQAKKDADGMYPEDAAQPFDPRGLYHAKVLFEALRAHGYYVVQMDAASYNHFMEEDIIEMTRDTPWELDKTRR